jgi:hypothetical protein
VEVGMLDRVVDRDAAAGRLDRGMAVAANMVRARIPPEYWKDHVIDVVGFLGIEVGDYRGRTEDLAGTWGDPGDYYGIWFDKDEIDALWPPT